MNKPLAEMDVRELLDEHYNATRKYRVTNSTLDIRAELERRIDPKPPVATPRPLVDLSIGALLYEYKFWATVERRNAIQAELERRTAPVPVAVPKPIAGMTFDELLKEHYRLYGEYTLEATQRLDLIINEIKSRRLTGKNA